MNLPVRYRPQRFDEIVGQDGVVRILKNALRREKISPVYLFAGPRGVGKTTTARVLAKALNCTKGVTPDPCGQCPPCLNIQQGRSLSVVEMDAASNRGIDDIREIRERIHVLPPDGRYKVYIIDEAHMLTREAFNALLKTLEEPPPHVVFILATTEPHRIPETVQSRAQRMDFRPVNLEVMAQRLMEIAEKEEIPLTVEGAREVARHARGGLRDALRLLERVALQQEKPLNAEAVRRSIGLPPEDVFRDLLQALEKGDVSHAWEIVQEGQRQGLLPQDWIQGLADMLENRMERALQGEEEDETRLLAWSRFLLEYDALYRYTRFDTLLFRYTLYRMARVASLFSVKAWEIQGGYPHRDQHLHQPPHPVSSTSPPPQPSSLSKSSKQPHVAPTPSVPEIFRKEPLPPALSGILASCEVEVQEDRVVIAYQNEVEREILERHRTYLEKVMGKPVEFRQDRARSLLIQALNLEEVRP